MSKKQLKIAILAGCVLALAGGGLFPGFTRKMHRRPWARLRCVQHRQSNWRTRRVKCGHFQICGETWCSCIFWASWCPPCLDEMPRVVELAERLKGRPFRVLTVSLEPDPVLSAMGLPPAVHSSAIRVSFSSDNSLADVDTLVSALDESIRLMKTLLGGTH